METPDKLSRNIVSFGSALAVASLLNALLVVAKEKIPAVMAGLQKLTLHHWVSHSLIILVLFLAFSFAFSRFNRGQGPLLATNRFIVLVVGGIVLGSMTIIGFYLING